MATLHLLIVTDSQDECDLIINEFIKTDVAYEFIRVRSEKELILAIDDYLPDIVICNYSLKEYSGLDALRYIKTKKPDLPVVIISNAPGEEIAVETMKAGADYYIMKNQLFRLVPAVLREIKEAQIKKMRRLSEENLKFINLELENQIKEKTHLFDEANKRLKEEIEERKRKEIELQKSYSRFTRLFQVSPIAMSISRLSDNKIIDINNAYLDLLEYSRFEVIGKDPTELNIWVNPQQRIELINKVIKQGTVLNQEVQVKTKSGKIKTILLSVEYLFAEDTEPWILFMGMSIDEIKTAETEMLKALEKEKELGILKNRFVSMISHEIRTPLTSIMLSTDLLRRHGDMWSKEQRDKYYDKIQQTVLRITRLLENVLTISRLEEGKFDFHPECLDLYDFCKTTAENVEFNTQEKNKIRVVALGDRKEISFDENLLGLAMTNLLNNAVKYSNPGEEILVEIKYNSDNVNIKIQDKGIGIPKDELQYLFQSFFRASNVGNVSGYGIGLSIVKKCIEAHNGTIDVESDVGKGTTFFIKLPIK